MDFNINWNWWDITRFKIKKKKKNGKKILLEGNRFGKGLKHVVTWSEHHGESKSRYILQNGRKATEYVTLYFCKNTIHIAKKCNSSTQEVFKR